MRQNLLTTLLCSMLFGLFFSIAQPTASQIKLTETKKTDAHEARFALLIGINDYTDPKIKDLQGTENDVKLMRGTLTNETYKFNSAGFKELMTSNQNAADKPTRNNIEKAFRQHLIENAKKYKELNPASDGATVLFYYSGHGSYVEDKNGDETDGLDETIVPMDSDAENGSRDIIDDELKSWFGELRRYTTNVTFIFDSCHSGTVTRGTSNKSIERDFKKGNSRGGGAPSLNSTLDASEDYVTISGSLPNEKSQESALKNPQTQRMEWDGYLTYYLVQQLRANQAISYRDLMQTVSTAVMQKNPDQTPQVEGDIDRAFLGSKESRGRRGIRILENNKEGRDTILKIEAGSIVGALPGGTIGIYGKNAAQLAGDNDRLGSGRIFESGDFWARVRVAEADVPADAQIILANPFFTNQKRKVALETSSTDAGSQMIKRLGNLLKDNNYVEALEMAQPLAVNPRDWNVAIVRGTFAEFTRNTPQMPEKDKTLPDGKTAGYYLASPNGNPLYNFWIAADRTNAETEIKKALELHTRVENLLAVDNNANASLNEGLKIELVKLKSFNRVDGSCTIYSPAELSAMSKDKTQLNPGDWFYIKVSNQTGKNLFPYIYDITTEGQIQMVYQPLADGDVLKSGAPPYQTFDGATCSGDAVLQAAAPFGKETFKLIVASKRFDGKLLESPSIALDFAARGRDTRGETGLDDLFAEAAINKPVARDGTKVVRVPFSGWATAKVEFEITEKKP